MWEKKHPKGKFEKLKSIMPPNFFQSLYLQQPIMQDVKDREDFDTMIKKIGFCPLDEKEIKHYIDDWRKIFEEFPAKWESDKPIYETITKGILSLKSKEMILLNLDIRIAEERAEYQYYLMRYGKIPPSNYSKQKT